MFERRAICGAKPHFPGSVDYPHAFVGGGDFVKQSAGSVRRIVVNEKDVQIRFRPENFFKQGFDVIPLVISTYDDANGDGALLCILEI